MAILKTLINLLIFSLPLGVLGRITLFDNTNIYPHDLFAGLILAVFVYKYIFIRGKVINKKLFFLAALFLIIGSISLLINSYKLEIYQMLIALAYLIRYASYLSIIFVFQFLNEGFKKTIPRKLIIAGLIFTFFGYIQYVFYNDLRNLYYLGWDEHLYRLFSTFLDPNFAGAFLVLVLTLLSGKILQDNKNRKFFFIQILCWLTILISIFLTHSRSAFVMLIIATVIFLLLNKMHKLLICLIVIFMVLLIVFSDRSIENLNPLRLASIDARVESAVNALDIISKNPIIGVGFNAYRYAQVRYELVDPDKTTLSNADAGTDNSYLFVVATTGVIGFVVFIKLWGAIITDLYRRMGEDKYIQAVFASIVALLVNTLFINSIFFPHIMAWIFILIGFSLNKKP